MSRDYGEIFCDAVNQLIQGSLSTLNYDITKNCTVVNINDRKYGKYQVSDGTIKFYAYATKDMTYELNDSVLVTVPGGDFNKQATIINKIADPLLGSVNYVSPFDTLLKGTGDVINKSITKSLTANGKESLASIITLDKKEFFGFTKVGLQADFSTLLKGQNIISGAYGLKLMLYSKKDNKDSAIDFTFSSYDMFGNPYEFESFYKQQIVFDIPKNLNRIEKIEVVFYQDGNFKDGNGTLIEALPEAKDSFVKDLFVRNIQVYFGYAADLKIEERVELSSPSLTYSDSTDKSIYLKWFHKVDENTLELIESSNWDKNKYLIRWYQYKPGCSESEIDEYGGQNWKWINSETPNSCPYDYPFEFSFKPNLMNTSEKFKVVVFVNDHPLHNDATHMVTTNYTSNILTFENADAGTAGGTTYVEDIVNKLSLHFDDGSDGNYFLYDQNGFLINSAEIGPTQQRTISLRYGGEEITKNSPIFNDIKSVTWEVPDIEKLSSMITYNNSVFKNPNKNLLNINIGDLGSKEGWQVNFDDISIEQHGSNNIVKVPIPENLTSDLYIYQDMENNNAGVYNFKSTVQVFNNVEDLGDEVRQQSTKVCLQVFTSNDNGATWSKYPHSKIFSTKCGLMTDIGYSFRILEEHTHLRVAIGYLKDQTYETIPKKEYQNFFVWSADSNTSFRLDSNFCTNTYYPSENEENNRKMTSFEYQISSVWAHNRSNNFIQCSVNIGDDFYSFNETLRFGPKGSNGTYNTFLLEMLDGKNALVINENEQLRVKAILLNVNNKEIEIESGITWELINGDSKYMSILEKSDGQNNVCVITIGENVNSVPSDNYAILHAKYTPDSGGPSLDAFLPIPMKISGCNYMTGADRIIYNHLGSPSYSDMSYKAKIEKEENYDWDITSLDSPNAPILVKSSVDGKQVLKAAPLYSKSTQINGPICDKVCVFCSDWSQPILIMQSNYDFAMLNDWDGTLTLNEKNGTILATMLGAGKKNPSDNTFSGVLIGDIKTGTDNNNTIAQTGVYGFQNGVMSYGLKEDGSGFFGADGNGRIEFDGTSGIIRSAGWTLSKNEWTLNNNSGTLLDLDDGMLLMHGSDNNYIRFNAKKDGKLEISIPSTSINLVDSNGSSKNIIDFTTDSIRSTISKQVALKTRCGTPFITPTKVIRMTEEDYLQWYDEKNGRWKFEKGTVISVKFNGDQDQETPRPSLENISFKFAWYPDDNPNINSPYYPTETTYKVASVNPNIFNTYKQGDTLVFEYDDSKFNLTDVGYSSMIQTTEGMISKVESQVRKVATYSATVSKLTNPLELTVLNAPSDLTAEQFYQDGTTLNVILEPAYTNVDVLADKELKFKFKERNVGLYMHGAYVGKNNTNFLTWKKQTSLCFMYRNTGEDEAWILVDSGSFQNFSEVKQTAEGVETTVRRAGIDKNGNINKTNESNFTMNITADGFYLNNKAVADASNFIFKCNGSGVEINGGGSFSGNLTANTTNFTQLQAGLFEIPEGTYKGEYSTRINKNGIILAAQWTKNTTNDRAGLVYIGPPTSEQTTFDDITIYARPLSMHSANYGGYGNLGLESYPWDMIYVKQDMSIRDVKKDIEIYNTDQAYEELKALPLYTYNYKGDTESSRSRFLGTMIDYLPSEVIRTTTSGDVTYFEPINLTYWNIAATQVIQSKLEKLIDKINKLEEQEYGTN